MKQTGKTVGIVRTMSATALATLWLAWAGGGFAAEPLEIQPGLACQSFGRADDAGRQGAWDGSSAAPNSSIAPEIMVLGDGRGYSARFTGMITAPADGEYLFRAEAHTGVRVMIANAWIIDGLTNAAARSGKATLAKGKPVPIVVDYSCDLGKSDAKAVLRLFWTPPGGQEAPVPAGAYSFLGRPRGVVSDPQGIAAQLLNHTGGAHCRLVWTAVNKQEADAAKAKSTVNHYKLEAFDTRTKTVRKLADNGDTPYITPDGTFVVFHRKDGPKPGSYAIPWEGGEERFLCKSWATSTWQDPTNKTIWAVACNGANLFPFADDEPKGFFRLRLDKPSVREVVYVTEPTRFFWMSPDGKRAAGSLHPTFGWVDLERGVYTQVGGGCDGAIAPDDSYRMFRSEGNHTDISVFDGDGSNPRIVRLGIEGRVDCPKWSNRVRFMTWVRPGVFLARLDENLTRVEERVHVASDRSVDYQDACGWIEPEAGKTGSVATVREKLPEKTVTPAPATNKPVWPTDDKALVFQWQNGHFRTKVVALDDGGSRINNYSLIWKGAIWQGPYYEMAPAGGFFQAPSVEKHLLRSIQSARSLSLQMWITPRDLSISTSGWITAFASSAEKANLVLAQEREQLLVRLGNAQARWIPLLKLDDRNSFHMALTCTQDRLAVYRNGREAGVYEVRAGLGDWRAQPLVFGNAPEGNHPWQGRLEGIAIHSRVLDAGEIRADAGAYAGIVSTRKPLPRVRVLAELTALTKTPEPKSILPYVRALCVYSYRVKKVIDGQHDSPTVQVAHWTILDGQIQPAAKRTAGKEYTLLLEPFADHAELSSELLRNDVNDDPDAKVHYSIELY